MKRFVYYQLIDEDNFCNYKKEQADILDSIDKGEKLVIYGQRNSGKTSLMKNIIAKRFATKHKRCLIVFADLLEAQTIEDIFDRINYSFSTAFNKTFPVRSFSVAVKNYLRGLQPQISIDSLTGNPSLGIVVVNAGHGETIQGIFESIRLISEKMPTLVILDEFQDIAKIAGAQATFRNALESLNTTPVVLMGSKQHLLSNLLANPKAPLAFWGRDIHLNAIPYEEYSDYINERFSQRQNHISEPTSKFLQDRMNRIPESINLLCDHIFGKYENAEISEYDVETAIIDVVDKIATRYESYLANFTPNEAKVFSLIAIRSMIREPMGKEFTSLVGVTPRAISRIIEKAQSMGIIEKTPQGYSLTDPLFREYLKKHKIRH